MTRLSQCVFAFFLLPVAISAQASTFWAARGATETVDGSTLVAYMRDDLAGEQTYASIRDEGSFAFKGIFVGRSHRFEAGLNEKGLFVGQISAASVARSTRLSLYPKRFKSKEGWYGGEWLIRNCASVAQALSKGGNVFSGYPIIYVLADRNEIAFVECLPSGKFHVQRTASGLLTHTNHFILPEAAKSNESLPASSSSRLFRIDSLLGTELKPYRLEQFLSMTLDEHAGPDLSLYRVGSKARSPKTTGVWLMDFPAEGAVQSHLRLLNGGTWKTHRERYPASAALGAPAPLATEALSKPLTKSLTEKSPEPVKKD